MTKPVPTIFVLWDAHFDAALAVTFVTQLRSMGFQVKLVGIRGCPSTGLYGILLTPDMTVTQAMTQIIHCRYVIIPCGSLVLKKLEKDIRLQEFCRTAMHADVQFVIGRINKSVLAQSVLLSTLSPLRILNLDEDIHGLVNEIAAALGD